MNLIVHHTGGFRRKEGLVSYTEYRQYGYRKEHYSHTAYPLCKASPEQHTVRKRLYVIEHGSAGSSETRHGFEKCVGYIVHFSAEPERHGTETRKQ